MTLTASQLDAKTKLSLYAAMYITDSQMSLHLHTQSFSLCFVDRGHLS